MVARPRKSVRMANITPLKTNTKAGVAAAAQLPRTPGKVPGFKAAPGRPQSNIGRYLIRPTDKQNTGFEYVNTEPQIIAQTEEKYLNKFELPPALQPKYLRKPEVLEVSRRKEISKGWVKPRSQV